MNLSSIISNILDFAILAYLSKKLLDCYANETSARAIFENITFITAILYCLSVFMNAFVFDARIQINLMLFVFFAPISLVFSLSMTNTKKSYSHVLLELLILSFGLQYLVHFPGVYYGIVLLLVYASKSIPRSLPYKTKSVHK